MSKLLLRQKILKTILELNKNKKIEIENKMYNVLFQSNMWKKSQLIGLTYSTEQEWNTIPIMKRAWQEGKRVCIPKSNHKTKSMDFYIIEDENDTIEGGYQIQEPKTEYNPLNKNEIDLLIVPGVVFNEEGFRIGFGGGFYDRFLIDFPNTTISLLASFQLNNALIVEKHDIAVQHLIIEDKILKV